jgi:hypothetical protein
MKKQIVRRVGRALLAALVLFTGTPLASTVSSFEPRTSEWVPDLVSLFNAQNSANDLESAYGGGTAVEFERRTTLSFNALRQSNGEVSGTLFYMFRDFDLDFKVQMKLDCMLIEGNRAKLSGLITQITANMPLPPWVVGARASMQVEDNGTPNADLPDRYSDFHFFQATCSDENEPYIPIDGNIVLNP